MMALFLVGIFSIAVLSLLKRFLPYTQSFLVLTALLTGPILLALVLYCLYIIFPEHPASLYILIILLLTLALLLVGKRPWKLETKKFTLPRLNIPVVIIGILVLFEISLGVLRIFSWPVYWDDQIYYIEHAYGFGSTRTLNNYFDWKKYDDGKIRFLSNPAIRPAVPILYSLAAFQSNDIYEVVRFSQIMTAYFLIMAMGWAVLLVSDITHGSHFENAVVTIGLIMSCFIFFNLAVSGFKEIILISQVMAILYLAKSKRVLEEWRTLIITGVICGLMAFINYSGSLITLIIFLIIFIGEKKTIIYKVKRFLIFGILVALFSGLEVFYFLNLAMGGSYAGNTPYKSTIGLIGTFRQLFTKKEKSNGYEYFHSARQQEFESYKIAGAFDEYTKGRLQGNFQIQYFGLIFNLFILVLIGKWRELSQSPQAKVLLEFLGIYYLIFLDLFGINKIPISYILMISHKYTALLVPLVGVIVGSQWQWLKTLAGKINIRITLVLCCISGIIGYATVGKYQNEILNWFSLFVPIHSTRKHYLEVLQWAGWTLIGFSTLVCAVILLTAFIKKSKASKWWRHKYLNVTIFYIGLIFLPFAVSFNSNLSFYNTLFYSLSMKEEKLTKIIGWEDQYGIVNYLNTKKTDNKILFIDISYPLLALQLNTPSQNIYGIEDMYYIKEGQITQKTPAEMKVNYVVGTRLVYDYGVTWDPIFTSGRYGVYAATKP